jgi:coproporphyrinogen III oxidase-like Fe-S oxidoreductase
MDLVRFAALGGHAIDETQLDGLAGDGLVARNGDRLMATRSGRLVLERLILEIAA